jgi:PAS domain S-box-containing protein
MQTKGSHHPYSGLLSLLLWTFVLLLPGVAAAADCEAAGSPPILVGSELDFPPYALTDKSGKPQGFSVDLIKAVAGAMGLSIKFSTGPWDTMWNYLVAGRLDVLPIVARSPERQHLVDFSLPHTETFDAFFVRRGAPPLPDIKSAHGKEIVVMRSDAAHHELLQRHFPGRIIPVATIPAGLALVAAGKHDAFLSSKLIGAMVIKNQGLTNLTAGPPIPDYKRVFSFAVKKGDAELLEKLNQGLLIIKTSGEYGRIYEKWLTADDPWQRWRKYLWPATAVIISLILIAVVWLVLLQTLVRKRTRELRRTQEGLEEEVARRTAELARANTALKAEIAGHSRAQEALRESEERYRSLVELSPLAVLVIAEGKYIFANQAAASLFGCVDPAYMVGRDVLALVPSEFREFVARRIKNVFAGDRESEQEAQILRLDGRAVEVAATAQAIDYQGQKAILVLLKDISERKQALKALQESRTDLNRAQALAQTGSWRLNVQSDELTWSEENHRIFGIPPGVPMTYETFLNTVHPEDREYVNRKWLAALQAEPYDIEHRILVDGEVKWLRERAELEFDAQGQLLGGFGTTQDITARKQAEEALQRLNDELEQRVAERTGELTATVARLEEEMRERLQAEAALTAESQRFYEVLESIPAQVSLLRPDYSFVFVNGEFKRRFADPGKKRCYELLGRLAPCGECPAIQVFQTGKPVVWEWADPDGRHYQIYDFPFTDADGSPLILKMGVDLTDRLIAEAEVHRLNEELEQRVKKRTEELELANLELEAFSYSVSHDLKAPLRAIGGFAAMLTEEHGAFLDQEGLRLVGVIRDNTRKMGDLIDNLLNLSRLGRQEMKAEELNLSRMAQSVFKELAEENPGRRLELNLKPLPGAVGDRTLIRQVLVNLLANAVKFTRDREVADLEVGGCISGPEAIFYVKDNGVGFDMRYAEKLFGVFQTLHSRRDFEGTGVGLALVQRIIRRHGGRVWAEGKVDRGATFYFTLPVPVT